MSHGNHLVTDFDEPASDWQADDAYAAEQADQQNDIRWLRDNPKLLEPLPVDEIVAGILRSDSPVIREAWAKALYSRGVLDGMRQAREILTARP